MRFQRRFTLDDLPQETTLQRAYVKYLTSGQHWLTLSGKRTFAPS